MSVPQKLTKRQKRLAEKGHLKAIPTIQRQHFDLKRIEPKTRNQEEVFDAYKNHENVMLLGCAGTGKSFISVYLALEELLELKSKRNRLVIIRSSKSIREQGFLPGTEKEKSAIYELPYKAICAKLFNRDDAYEILKSKGILEFHSTSYLRGLDIEDAIILVDEVQNTTYNELKSVLTRTGNGSRLVLCGDIRQDDLTSKRYNEESGLRDIIEVLEMMDDITIVDFGIEDIVRSGFVKEFLKMEYKLGKV